MLKQEYGTASNIKSTTTRKNVQDAIVKVQQRLKLFRQIPENGLVIFCGAVPQNGPGSERIETYVIIPPEPIKVYLYRCDSRFHIEPLLELLREREAYGIILIDASEATFALLKGRRLEILQRITSGVPGKHRAGGQSARRFERLREMRLNEYYRRVGQHANELFLEMPDLKGIIIGGPGPTKQEFEKGDYLNYQLKQKILEVVDTAYVDEQGVKEIVEKAPEIMRRVRYVEEKEAMQEDFKSCIANGRPYRVDVQQLLGTSYRGRSISVASIELLTDEQQEMLVKTLFSKLGKEKIEAMLKA